MSDSEDEDLRKAITLSLRQCTPEFQGDIIDLISSDDEDDDLDAPITTKHGIQTKQPSQNNTTEAFQYLRSTETNTNNRNSGQISMPSPSNGTTNKITLDKSLNPEPSTTGGSLLGLNRRQMEEERLLRASQKRERDAKQNDGTDQSKKRKPSDSYLRSPSKFARQVRAKLPDTTPAQNELPHPSPSKLEASGANEKLYQIPDRSKDTKSPSLGANKSQGLINMKTLKETHQERHVLQSYKSETIGLSSAIRFPNGIVKRTWAYGFPRGDDIKIEEVFEKDDLELAVLSSFQVDPQWVESKLNPKTKVIWVLQAKTEEEKENYLDQAPENYRFCFPNMQGNIHCMHSKLQLLAHPTYLRICVPTANLVKYDWGETGVMENVCFLIDLPRLPAGQLVELDKLTEFGKELVHFVGSMGLEEKVIASIRKFDFSRTSHLAFIHTIGGSHSGAHWKRTGYCGLGNAVRKLGLHTEEALKLDFVTASIGNLNYDFLKSIYLAAQGDDGLKEYDWRTEKAKKSKAMTSAERKLSDDLINNFRIYFPTRDTVAESKGGIDAGGTINFQSKWYDSEAFPKRIMRDCKSQRKGLLMHNKMLFVRPSNSPPHNVHAWAYIGSANLSESAWGRLVRDKTTKGPKLNCRNWECGVLVAIPPHTTSDLSIENPKTTTGDNLGSDEMDIFRKIVPVPMIVPAKEYGAKRPWFYNET